ncbi:hypothetical protein CNEO_50019 [Clostridium neonatale]|uniref:Uncharacterized protein n=1 Tax=Clostridium neonatale TaxID=137838 RepID=A0AA86MQQ6_9CLOT|nr:hypothetical protein CNEO_50019 [Clostridium neonatale]
MFRNELYEAFIKECQELDMSEDLIIKNMIKNAMLNCI